MPLDSLCPSQKTALQSMHLARSTLAPSTHTLDLLRIQINHPSELHTSTIQTHLCQLIPSQTPRCPSTTRASCLTTLTLGKKSQDPSSMLSQADHSIQTPTLQSTTDSTSRPAELWIPTPASLCLWTQQLATHTTLRPRRNFLASSTQKASQSTLRPSRS